MRYSACRFLVQFFLSLAGLGMLFFGTFASPAFAQAATDASSDYHAPSMDANVPRNQHTYTQSLFIEILSTLHCELIGIDPIDPTQPCLGVNPVTKKIGYEPTAQTAKFGQASHTPQVGGLLGTATTMVSALYTPTVSSTQYFNYLAGNFGIVKTANAAAPAAAGIDCNQSPFGYGFCGLQPVFTLWTTTRDFAYAILVLAFVGLGLGVMLRFKVDPRTVMTLQNQIPRAVIAILLITFSYAISGFMIDLMWTITYTGINVISAGSKDAQGNPSKVNAGCPPAQPGQPQNTPNQTVGQAASFGLLDQPVSFVNTIFNRDCNGTTNSGIVNLSGRVSESFGGLVAGILNDLFGLDRNKCDLANFTIGNCIASAVLWVTQYIILFIVIIAVLIALFRLWFQLIKAYITTLIFVILGPIWIVLGLIPGRPLGFEKWLRTIFANLAAFPLVAFILVFARVLMDSVQTGQPVDPQSVFIPPLVGNPNVAGSFGVLLGFGALLIAPSIPEMIREKMKAPQSKLGASAAAGIGVAAGVISTPATKFWKATNRTNSNGLPEGTLSVWKSRLTGMLPGVKKIRQRTSAYSGKGKGKYY